MYSVDGSIISRRNVISETYTYSNNLGLILKNLRHVELDVNVNVKLETNV